MTAADPDLQIERGGGEGCHPVPEISGGPVLQQIFPPLHDYLTIIPRAQMGH